GTVRSAEGSRCRVETELGMLDGVATDGGLVPGMTVTCSIRPPALEIARSDAPGTNCVAGEVEHLSFLGELVHLRVRAGGKTTLIVASLPHLGGHLKPGDRIMLE